MHKKKTTRFIDKLSISELKFYYVKCFAIKYKCHKVSPRIDPQRQRKRGRPKNIFCFLIKYFIQVYEATWIWSNSNILTTNLNKTCGEAKTIPQDTQRKIISHCSRPLAPQPPAYNELIWLSWPWIIFVQYEIIL